jgi:hypothetical protein
MSEQKNSNKNDSCEANTFDSFPVDSSAPPTSLPTSRDFAYSDGTFHKGEFIIDVMFSLSIFIFIFLNIISYF